MYYTWLKDRTPPETNPDIGFHNELFDVELAVFGIEVWGVLPFAGGLFDQPEALLQDMLRYIGQRAAVQAEAEGLVVAPDDAYEDLDPEFPKVAL